MTFNGNVAPAQSHFRPELETTALSPPFSQTLCGNPPGTSEIFVSGGGNWLLTARSDQLGTASSVQFLPMPPDTIPCPIADPLPRYDVLTDHNISRLPDGRLINTNLGRKRGPGAFCFQAVEIERAIIVRTSDDCGTTWQVSVIDASDIGAPHPPGWLWLDRQNLYVDVEQRTMYIAVRIRELVNPDPDFPDRGTGGERTVILRAPTDFPGTVPAWETIASLDVSTVTAMTSRSEGQEWLWLLNCSGVRPRLTLLENAVSAGPEGAIVREADTTSLPDCEIVPERLADIDLFNAVPQPGIAPVDPGPSNRLRLVYPDRKVSAGIDYQIAHVVDVQLDDSSEPIAATIVRQRTIDASANDRHILWTDLTASEGFETNPLYAGFQVLTYVRMSDSTFLGVGLGQQVISEVWRNEAEGWLPAILDESIVSPNRLLPIGGDRLWFGDYRYGTFVDQLGARGRPRYFVPYAITQPQNQVHGALWRL